MLSTIMKLLKSRKKNADVGKQQHMLYVVGVLASMHCSISKSVNEPSPRQ